MAVAPTCCHPPNKIEITTVRAQRSTGKATKSSDSKRLNWKDRRGILTAGTLKFASLCSAWRNPNVVFLSKGPF